MLNVSKTLLSVVVLPFALMTPANFASAEETVEAKIARAVSAAHVSISGKATVMDMDGTILREGENGWTCIPGVPLIPGNKNPMCNDGVWMDWIDAAKRGEEFVTEQMGTSYMLQGDAMVSNSDPMATDPNNGDVWVQEGPHLMLLLPKSALGVLSRDPYAGGPYVMWGDTPMAHVMVPLDDKHGMPHMMDMGK